MPLAIPLAIYGALQARFRHHSPDAAPLLTCDNVFRYHLIDTPPAPTDQKVGGSYPSQRANDIPNRSSSAHYATERRVDPYRNTLGGSLELFGKAPYDVVPLRLLPTPNVAFVRFGRLEVFDLVRSGSGFSLLCAQAALLCTRPRLSRLRVRLERVNKARSRNSCVRPGSRSAPAAGVLLGRGLAHDGGGRVFARHRRGGRDQHCQPCATG